MQMTAAVLYELGLPSPYATSKPFHIEDVDLEGPGDGEVLVEVRGAGLCHSDLSIIAGYRKRLMPAVGGHEGAGIIREVGRGVDGLKPGDHVVMTLVAGCGHCRLCYNSRPSLCETLHATRAKGNIANGTRHISRNGKPINHYSGVSSFAQYSVLVPDSVIKIDPAVPMDVAAMFGCAVLTGAGSVFNAARVRPGEHVAVIGLGGVGLNTIMAARIAGASKIIGIDLLESKFALAKELGCTDTFLATDPKLVEAVKDITHGGVDASFEVTGNRNAMATANAITVKGGQVICIGMGSVTDLFEYAHTSLVLEEKAFRGSLLGTAIPKRDIPQYVQMYLDGKMPVDKLKSDTMGFDQINESLDRLDRGEVVRQILLPHGCAQ